MITCWTFYKNWRNNTIYDLKDRGKTKGNCQLQDLVKNNGLINENFEYITKSSDITKISGTVLELEEKVDRLEQYSRRNCLLIHGVKEEKSENNNGLALLITKNDLNEEVKLIEIDRTHRFGKASS